MKRSPGKVMQSSELARLAKACCKTSIFQIPSPESKISWSNVARCCFELPFLTGNRQIPIGSGGPWVCWPGGPMFP
jgi:hypothetical protein